MLPACGRAHELGEALLAQQAEEADARAAKAAVVVEQVRPRSIAEAHLVVYEVPRVRAGVMSGPELWGGSLQMMLWQTEDALYLGHRALPGVHAPARWSANGARLLEGHEMVPVDAMPAREPDRAALEFLHAIRVEAACNFGAVRELVPTIPPRAHELAKQWAGTLLSPQPTLAWRTDWLCELFIRCAEFRMRVDVALIKVLLPALDEAWKKLPQNEPIKIPTHRALTHDLDGNLLQRPDEFKLVERYGEGDLPSPKHARDARREARRCSDERPLRRGRRVVRSAATGTRSEWHQTIEEANIEVTRETRQSNVMANSLSSYEPTPAHRALAAEGLTLLDQETLAAFATRVGWKMDAEDWPTFLDRKRGTSSRADADAGPAFREDAAAHGHPPDHVEAHARSVGEPSNNEPEPDASKARKDMVKRKKDGWKMSKQERAKARKATEEVPNEAVAQQEEEEGDEPELDAAACKAASDARKKDGWKAPRR